MTTHERWLLDTDILIDYLRHYPKAVDFLQNLSGNCFVSSITIAELFAGVRNEDETHILGDFLHLFEPVDITVDVAKLGGAYRKDYGKSHGTGLADALIAASATLSKTRLITFNKKHFPMLENIFVPYEK